MNSKAEKEIHESLNSCNDTKITDAIQKIIKKDFFVFIPKLATLYVTTQNEDIKRIIADSFYCLKKPDSILHIISVISDKSLVKDNKMLIASCWNTGLDYAPHLEFFTNLVASTEYETAIEAFTVIEEAMHYDNIEETCALNCIAGLKSKIEMNNREKSYLYVELIKVLEKKLQQKKSAVSEN